METRPTTLAQGQTHHVAIHPKALNNHPPLSDLIMALHPLFRRRALPSRRNHLSQSLHYRSPSSIRAHQPLSSLQAAQRQQGRLPRRPQQPFRAPSWCRPKILGRVMSHTSAPCGQRLHLRPPIARLKDHPRRSNPLKTRGPVLRLPSIELYQPTSPRAHD